MSHTIIVDSSCDITEDMNQWYDLVILSSKSSSRGSTSGEITPFEYFDAIERAGDCVYIITPSDELSNNFRFAVNASQMYKLKHPNKKSIHVFNSKGFGGVQTLLAMKIKLLSDLGAGFQSIVALTEYTCANKTQAIVFPLSPCSILRDKIIKIPKLKSRFLFGKKLIIVKRSNGTLQFSKKRMSKDITSDLSLMALTAASNYGGDKKHAVVSYNLDSDMAAKITNHLKSNNIFDTVTIAKVSDNSCIKFQNNSVSISIAV